MVLAPRAAVAKRPYIEERRRHRPRRQPFCSADTYRKVSELQSKAVGVATEFVV